MRINLSASQAEDLLATIWIALEKHGCTSPKMEILSRGSKLQIELHFESGRDEDLVKAELPLAMVTMIQGRCAIDALRPALVHGSFARPQVRALLSARRCRRLGPRLAG